MKLDRVLSAYISLQSTVYSNQVKVKEDAKLLDVYHTDGSSLTFKSAGILKPIGHLDFYPNNGTDQPHCHLTDSNLNPAEASVCDHIAAYQYFIQVCYHY